MSNMAGLRRLLIAACAATVAACGGSGGGGGDDGGTAPPPIVGNPPPTSPGTVDTTPPSVPASFTAIPASPTQVTLSWDPATDDNGVAGYRLYRDGSSEPIATVTVTHYSDTGLAANTAYVYTLRAYDAASPANESALTAPVSVTTPPAPAEGDSTPPSVPRDVNAIATSTTSIQVSWSPSTDASGIAEYRVYREGRSVAIAVTQNTTFNDTQLDPNTTYRYFVTAVDGASPANESARSDAATATTGPGTGPGDTTPPTVPGNLVADARSSTTIRLRWDASRDQSGIAEYRVYRNGGAMPIAATQDAEYLDTGLTANTAYQYTVTAIDRAVPPNESAQSNIASATTQSVGPGPGPGPGDIIAPAPPENLVATARSATEIDLVWTAAVDPSGISGYSVYRDGAPDPIATVPTTSYTDGGLEPASTHTYTVRATDNADNTSADSAPASATTRAAPLIDFTPPSPPENLRAVTQGSTSIELHWDASTDESGIREYRIYRSSREDDQNDGEPVAIVTGTSYVDEGLTPDTRYTYRVRAVDRAFIPNVSRASAPARARTLGG